MMVMMWNALFLSLLLCYQPFACANKKKSSSRLVKRVDSLLKEIDVAHDSHMHDSMAGMEGMNMGPEKPQEHAHMHEVAPAPVQPQAAPVAVPAVVAPVVTPAVQAVAETKSEAPTAKMAVKAESPDQTISDIDRAKQQIKTAEVELAKLKELVRAAEASPAIEDVKKVVALNKSLISVFDKQIRDYRSRGVPYADSRIKQLQENIRVAEQELAIYEKQLKNITSMENITPPVEVIKKKTEVKKDEEAVVVPVVVPQVKTTYPAAQHEHAAIVRVQSKKPVQQAQAMHEHSVQTVAQHEHVTKPVKQKTEYSAVQHAHDMSSPAPKMVQQKTAHTHAAPAAAVPSHDHVAAMPVSTKGDAAMDHAHMPPPGDETYAEVSQSSAYKNLHAYHYQGLSPSSFKISPFGFIQNEISFATRQLSVIQEFQPFLVPINVALDANNVDVEDRSQFIPALHAHAGTLISGPDILNAHASGDFSLEFYAPFPLNYAPATDPGLSVRIAGIILVHASMFVEWEKTTLLLGQTWHPGEDPEVAISLDRVTFFGTLSDPMNRLFQVRITQKVLPQFKFIAALTSNLDFKAAQNLGIDKDQIQNPYWLNFHFQGRAQINQNVFAVAADIYTEQPRLFETTQLMLDNDVNEFARQQYFPNTLPNCPTPTRAFSAGSFDNNAAIFATKKSVTSFSMMGFVKVDRDPFVFKAKVLAGSSLGHPLGGFAVIDACTSPTPVLNTMNECAVTGVNECFDPTSPDCNGGGECTILTPSPCIEPLPLNAPYQAIRGYGPMRIATFAAGLYLKNKIEPGIYIGVTKNLGSKDKIWQFKDLSPLHQECSATNPQTFLCQGTNGLLNASIFKYVSDLDYTILVAPRIKWTIAPVTFSAEIEYTRASYVSIGGVITDFGTVTCSNPVDVIRFLLEGSFNF